MKKYRTFIATDKNGVIVGRYMALAEEGEIPNPDRPIEVTHEDDLIALRNRGHKKCLWDARSQRVVSKPEVVFSIRDTNVKKADGEDTIVVDILGVPETVETIKVQVGDQIAEVDPSEPLEINSNVDQNVWISLREHCLFAESKHVRFREELDEEPI